MIVLRLIELRFYENVLHGSGCLVENFNGISLVTGCVTMLQSLIYNISSVINKIIKR